MALKLYKPIKRGAVKQSIYVEITESTNHTPQTGKVAADLAASYARSLSARVAITLADLAAVTTAWTSGGVKEIDATNMPGLYRIDLPDAMFVVGSFVDEVNLTINGTGLDTLNIVIPLWDLSDYNGASEGTTRTDS